MARSLRRRVARLGLWFDDDAAMDRIMNSPAMATAFEDATRFGGPGSFVSPCRQRERCHRVAAHDGQETGEDDDIC